ncbi:hypothetical protein PR048_000257 [Dryococelus australis]|uniref:Uncharacterized protein n=1 Tax=Dryococelus australis TaxID=614101 RepID=A0ABQ9IE53_9NEOP|nr:hypothetical protein PR048_000257 [Dryococelus australis]
MMVRVLDGLVGECALAFLDDVIVCYNSWTGSSRLLKLCFLGPDRPYAPTTHCLCVRPHWDHTTTPSLDSTTWNDRPAVLQYWLACLFAGVPPPSLSGDTSHNIRPDEDDNLTPAIIHIVQYGCECLAINGLSCANHKCHIGKTSIQFLGNIVDEDGIWPMPEQLYLIESYPAPTTQKQVRIFFNDGVRHILYFGSAKFSFVERWYIIDERECTVVKRSLKK